MFFLYLWSFLFDIHGTVHRVKFLIIKSNNALISQIFTWNETLHVSDSSSVHHQEFFTVNTAKVFVIHVCWQLRAGSVPSWCCSQAVSQPVWHIPLPCVQWKTPDDGQRNCPKHVEFHSKNKYDKLVHLVGFIIRSFSVYLYGLKLSFLTLISNLKEEVYYTPSELFQQKLMVWFIKNLQIL